ncbi:MAG: Uma2 family endonuclease [Pirellulaceae bacterium]|nr:Uma2 family endonuclease [Pirellulaceae bacterium]
MPTLILDAELELSLRAERSASGADQRDEVWEGVYVMVPLADDERQELVTRFTAIFQEALGWPGLAQVRAGVNVSDRSDDWQQNYRIPDVAVFLPSGAAVNRGSYWQGGPDFAVEIVSSQDRTRDKLEFYSRVRVGELLVVDRQPWRLELCRLESGRWQLAESSALGDGQSIASRQLPFSFCWEPTAAGRPVIVATHLPSGRQWQV